MKKNKHIEELFKFNRCLLGEGYNKALDYIKNTIGLDVIKIPSGTELGTWTVPDEWIVKDAWVKFKGKKIIDYKKNPLSLAIVSLCSPSLSYTLGYFGGGST